MSVLPSKLRPSLGAALLSLLSACQVSTFVHHAEQVQAGETVLVDLQAFFQAESEVDMDGQFVACVALPEGWTAPEGAWLLPELDEGEGDGTLEETVSAEAEAVFAQEGSTWHCLVTDRMVVPADTGIALAQLALEVPASVQGHVVLPYLTGSRVAEEQAEGDGGVSVTFQPTVFSALARRTLNVGTGPATTFDHWELATSQDIPEGLSLVPIEEASTVVWGQGRFLLSTDVALLSSEDGRMWTELETTIDEGDVVGTPTVLLFAQGRFYAALEGDILASTDKGATWTTVYAAPESEAKPEVRAMAAAEGLLVAVGDAGLILTSTDGIRWQEETLESGAFLSTVTAGEGVILAGGEGLVRRKADGTGWEDVLPEVMEGRTVDTLVYGNGQFLAATTLGEVPEAGELDAPLFVSGNGTDWSQVQGYTVMSTGGEDVMAPVTLAYVDHSFLATHFSAEDSLKAGGALVAPSTVFSSVEGTTWTAHATGYAGLITAFAEGGGRVVGVAPLTVLVAETRAWPAPTFLTESLPWGVVGQSYTAMVHASGEVEPVQLTVSAGQLPEGLTFVAGALSGTPTQAGTTSLTLTATDKRGVTSTKEYRLRVAAPLAISTATQLPDATKGTAYRAVIAVEGGAAPYQWEPTMVVAAPGLSFAQEGNSLVLSGTPTELANASIVVNVTDASGQKVEKGFALKVVDAPAAQAQGCGCTQTGGALGLELLAFAGLALLRRRARRA